jgi:beta-glucosidase/6-phospho-beta-glucosidase/beta-galactosidase
VPDGLHKLLLWIKDHYNNPSVVIAENGYSDDGQTDDYDRISYMKEHFTSVKKAMDDGCNIEAYTMWSLLDNFEWARGYSEKFGIFKINFESENKERILKKSSEYFRDVIKERKILDVDLSGALDFTYDFQFGSATSSYQIEGAWDSDGKVENIWDHAVHNNPEAIFGGDTGDFAADSYRLYKEDVKAMKTIGVSLMILSST